MADHDEQGGDQFDCDPAMARLLDLLRDGPLASPPAASSRRAKALARQSRPGLDVVGGVIEFVAQLVFDSRASLSLAGFRGASAGAHLLYRFEAGEIDVELLEAGGREGAEPAGRMRLRGQVEAQERAVRASLRSGRDDVVAEAPVDERGMFTLEAAPGRYDLIISLERTAVSILSLEL